MGSGETYSNINPLIISFEQLLLILKNFKWRNKGEEEKFCMVIGREETDSRRKLFRTETSCDRPFNSGISL